MSQQPDASTLELLPDATVIVDASGAVVAANQLACRLAGLRREALLGAAAAEALPLVDESGNQWWECARPAAGDPRLLPRLAEQDLTLHSADGRQRPVTVTAARAAEDGRVGLAVISLRRAERRQRLDAARSELVSTVSHEIRSPLTSVKGFTQTLLAKWDRFNDEQKRQMLATINDDADRVTRLLEELLEVSRIDAGRVRLRRQMIDLAALVERVSARQRAGEDGERLAVEAADGLPELYADPDRVEQVLTNLLENALRHGEGTVTITVRPEPEAVEVRISDQGPGIPEAQQQHIFGKFFRGDARRSGTGLGLYITKGLVEAHGGRIWVESSPQGTSFCFTLPRGGLELAGVPSEGDRDEATERA